LELFPIGFGRDGEAIACLAASHVADPIECNQSITMPAKHHAGDTNEMFLIMGINREDRP
jgi:hypothetical protein